MTQAGHFTTLRSSANHIRMISSTYFKKYLGDWILCIVLQLYVLIFGLRTTPFLREFNLRDPSIQHPFTTHEQVSDILCLILATFIPGTIILARALYTVKFLLNKLTKKDIHFFHISLLSLVLSVTITGFIVVILKNWISRPRPDFIARCAPDTALLVKGKDTYTIDICTGSYEMILEGLRSTPSGHSALAFSGLHFVTVWMFIQFDVLCNQYHVWKMLLCSTPEWLAIWIALSRTQDYRHHFGDILMGGLLGIAIAHLILCKMFKRKEAVYLQEPDSLPLYTTVD